jgi:hypothetical protein
VIDLRIEIPESLKKNVLFECHNHVLSGHLDIKKTYHRIAEKYYWMNMYEDVRDWVNSCADCSMRKAGKTGNSIGMSYSIESSRPFEMVGIDIKGPLSLTKNQNRYILVITDHFTKWVEVFPMKNGEAATVAKIIVEEFVCRHGAPEKILTDRGRNFTSKLINEISEKLDIKRILTASYHPQTNGQPERFNRTMGEMLTMYVSDHQQDWDEYLPYIAFAYRTAVNDSTRETPFKMLFGRDVRLGENWKVDDYNSELESQDLVERMHSIWEKVKEYSDRVRAKREIEVNSRRKLHEYRLQDLVWLKAVPKPGKVPTFQNKWIGPYRIVEFVTPVTVILKDLGSNAYREPVPVSRLKKYVGEDIPDRVEDPEQNDEYEISGIEDVRIRKKKRQYLIRWKDYEELTWEKEENVISKDIIVEFHRAHQLLCTHCGYLATSNRALRGHQCPTKPLGERDL